MKQTLSRIRSVFNRLGLEIGTNQGRFLGGFLKLSGAESVNFHRVQNQVLKVVRGGHGVSSAAQYFAVAETGASGLIR